jgi:hypothetical protein
MRGAVEHKFQEAAKLLNYPVCAMCIEENMKRRMRRPVRTMKHTSD